MILKLTVINRARPVQLAQQVTILRDRSRCIARLTHICRSGWRSCHRNQLRLRRMLRSDWWSRIYHWSRIGQLPDHIHELRRLFLQQHLPYGWLHLHGHGKSGYHRRDMLVWQSDRICDCHGRSPRGQFRHWRGRRGYVYNHGLVADEY